MKINKYSMTNNESTACYTNIVRMQLIIPSQVLSVYVFVPGDL